MNPISSQNPALRSNRITVAMSVLLLTGCLSGVSQGQQTAKVELPEAPGYTNASAYSSSAPVRAIETDGQITAQPYQTANTADDSDGKQTKRILGIIPNFRAVSANQHLPPQTSKDKFLDAFHDSFDYSSVFIPALLAGYNQARNETPEFHQGGLGYSRYLWHSAADQTDENLWVEFIVPVIAHEDTRYYTLGKGGFKKRSLYAVKHVIICRDDAGRSTFNSGEIVGAGISSGLSNLYYPSAERTVGNTLSQYGINVGIDAFTFAFKEFWPDINNHLFHLKDE